MSVFLASVDDNGKIGFLPEISENIEPGDIVVLELLKSGCAINVDEF